MKNTDNEQKLYVSTILFLLINLSLQILNLKISELIVGKGNDTAYITTKVLIGISVVLIILFLRFTPMDICLTSLRPAKKGLKTDLVTGFGVSAALIIAMVIIRQVMNESDPEAAARPAFALYLGIHTRWFYPVSSLLQEMYVKCFVQHNIRRSMDTSKPLAALAAAGLFFFLLHTGYPLYYMLGAWALCFFTGILYERTGSIWGSVMIHFVIGFMPRALGLK